MSTGATPATHLVVVCCHSTYDGQSDPRLESSWVLEPFRRANPAIHKPSEHHTLIQHILAGASILDRDPTALLVFSGGRTQNEVESTEAESYKRAYGRLANGDLDGRIACENNATDSFQNLLFSILLFRRETGAYPQHISLITHAFKERRFLHLHAPAIRWPADRIRTMGINPAFTREDLDQIHRNENENAFKHFIVDPYGLRPPLSEKRTSRNWNSTVLEKVAESLEDRVTLLLKWDGGPAGKDIYSGPLPWA